MKEILKVKADKDNFYISVDGSNIDLLSAIAHTIKAMEKESDMVIEVALEYLKKELIEE